MKKNILIVLFLVVAQLLAFYKVHSQDSSYRKNCGHVATIKKDLLGDETYMIYNKTEAVIYCSNEGIARQIIIAHRQLMTKYGCRDVQEGKQTYKEWIIHFNKSDAEFIKKWAKTNL